MAELQKMNNTPNDKSNDRPFGQSNYDKKLLVPTWKDFHYKFILFLPLTESTFGSSEPPKQVFLEQDLRKLDKLFLADFEGFTHRIANPSEIGQWPMLIAAKQEIIINEHAQYTVYSQRTRAALNYFDELKERLEIRTVELGAKQDIIVIDQSEVNFSTKPSFNKDFLEHLLRTAK